MLLKNTVPNHNKLAHYWARNYMYLETSFSYHLESLFLK